MKVIALILVLIYSVSSHSQTISSDDENLKKTVSLDRISDPIFNNSIFVKGSFGMTSARVDEWESTTYITSSSGGGSLSGSFFPTGGSSTAYPNYNSVQRDFRTVSFKAGNKWIFGTHDKWRRGLQITWFKYTAFIPVSDGDFKQSLSLGMAGFNNTIKLTENSAIEFNGNFGLSFTKNNLRHEQYPRLKGIGVSSDLELNYRYKKVTLGVDASSIFRSYQQTDWSSLKTISVSVGVVI